MIVTCGQCGVKLKVDDSKIAERGSKLKCPKCSNIFMVFRPEPPAELHEAPPTPPPPPPAETPPPPPPVQEEPAPAEPPVKKWPLDRNKVLVAHDGESVLSLAQAMLKEAGYEVLTATEGVEAMVAIEREMPFAAVLDVALPRIYGFEICDRLKNNPESSDIKVILIASIFEKTRYKREPVSLYGADDYVEKHHIQDYLVQKLKRLASGQDGPTALGPREEEMWRHPAGEDPALREEQARQMKAEREKRANILEAEGKRAAAILEGFNPGMEGGRAVAIG